MKLINSGIKGLWYYCLGNIFAFFMYDRKYLDGKYFSGRFGGICAIGWRWVVADAMGRFFYGYNKNVPFPVSPRISVINPKNIQFHVDNLNNFQGNGNYFQAIGKIKIGKDCWIASNVGIITVNHDLLNPNKHILPRNVELEEKCWIGMNSMILPGVRLGPHTTVAAGAIVTKSFEEGYCVIAGNPARKIRDIKKE